jgi:hypothetical protein
VVVKFNKLYNDRSEKQAQQRIDQYRAESPSHQTTVFGALWTAHTHNSRLYNACSS